MKETFLKHLLEICFQQDIGNFLGVDPDIDQGCNIGHFERFYILQDQDAPGGMLTIDFRNINTLAIGMYLGKTIGIISFRYIVKFFPQCSRKFIQQGWDIGATPDRRLAHQDAGYDPKSGEVNANHLFDIRPLNLDDDRFSALLAF